MENTNDSVTKCYVIVRRDSDEVYGRYLEREATYYKSLGLIRHDEHIWYGVVSREVVDDLLERIGVAEQRPVMTAGMTPLMPRLVPMRAYNDPTNEDAVIVAKVRVSRR